MHDAGMNIESHTVSYGSLNARKRRPTNSICLAEKRNRGLKGNVEKNLGIQISANWVGLEVGLILPANGEADSGGHPEACGSQPLDLALIGNRQSCCEVSETESALPIATSLSVHTVCLYLLFRAVSKSVSALTASHWLILCRLGFRAFFIGRKTLNSAPAPCLLIPFDAPLMRLER